VAKSVNLNELEPGSILAEPVLNSFGQTLIAGGAEINQKHISILKTWNIQSVKIKTDSNEEIEKYSDMQLQLALEKLMQHIKWQPRNRNEEDLLKLGTLFFVEKTQ
jgi:hypothetical protein